MVDVIPDDDRRQADRGPDDAHPAPAEGEAAGDEMLDAVTRKAQRRQDARREGRRALASGFGVFGLVGWSVAVPTLLGIALGVWIDRSTESQYSWTLMLMIAGLAVGSFNAWYWVQKETERD